MTQRNSPGVRPRPRRLTRRERLRRTISILVVLTVAGVTVGGVIAWRNRPRLHRPGEDIPEITRRLARNLPDGAPAVSLVNVTSEAGLDGFVSFAGPRSSQLPEDMGAGAAWGDFDNDGDDDLFLVSAGGALGAAEADRAPSLLYENLSGGRFRVVADFPTLRLSGMGAAWGDADGDGWLDLFVTGFDRLVLLRNRQGRLVPDDAFPSRPGFWAGASWGDFDLDRDLDLYVCGYVQYVENETDEAKVSRQFGAVVPYTLNPSSYEPERNLLFRNRGDGTFEEVAETLGVSNPAGRSLGAVWHDFDQDGWLDLYVANDVSDNAFYRNVEGRFEDISHAAWVADYRGAMGLAVGDFDRDGDDDLFITHWVAQENGLYESLLVDLENIDYADAPGRSTAPPPPVRFGDVGSAVGVGQRSIQMVGWGAEFVDLDGDGWLDLVVANGSTFETEAEPKRLEPQASFLFWNSGGRYFHDLAPLADTMAGRYVSHGLAVCDYDDDGDQDILFVDLGSPPRLLRNDMQTGHWLEVRLRSRAAGGMTIGFGDGSTVVAEVGATLLRRTVGGVSYLSQSSRTLHLGLGDATRVDRLSVHWLGGGMDVYTDLAADTRWELREGDPVPRALLSREIAPGRATDVASLSDRERVKRFWSAQRGAIHAMKVDEDLPAAIALFREALALDPAHGDARYYLANCLAATGDVDEAIAELRTLSGLDPNSHRAFKRLGTLLAFRAGSADEMKDARAVLARALEINPEETGVLTVMGEVAILLGDHADAAKRLAWVGRTNPRAVGAFFLRAYVAWKDGDRDEAETLLGQAAAGRGEDWKPPGTTAEGDVINTMHADETLLSRFSEEWNGTTDPDAAFRAVDGFVRQRGLGAREP